MKKRSPTRRPIGLSGAHDQQLNRPGNGTGHLIAIKAYELYEQRGRVDGHALEDWIKAEAILRGATE